MLGVLRDVTVQKGLLAVDRLFHSIDTRVLQGQRQQALFDFICAEVACIFGFDAVWIGQRKKSGAVTVISAGGGATDFIETLRRLGVRWDDSLMGQGSVGRAIRSGMAQAVAVTEMTHMPWSESAERAGLRSFFSIPLILRGDIYGSFNLISQRDDSFRQASVLQGLTDIACRICVSIERAFDQEQLQLLGIALSSAANGVLITDQHGRIDWVNPAFELMTGYSRDELFGSTPRQFGFGSEKGGLFQDVLDGKVAGSAWCGESIERHRDGSAFNVRQTITPIRGAGGETTHFISILEDVTASRQAEESVRRLAYYDYLTDLPTRALFHDRLTQAVALARRGGDTLALVFLDLDHFKQVNDTHGHDMGDELLKGVAKRLLACVRESDTVARLAGDEFIIIMPTAATSTNATIVAEKIVVAIAEPFEFGQVRLQIGVSIGIAFFPEDADDEALLLKHADAAMYEAKAGGRNGFRLYQPEMQRNVTKEA